MSNKQTLFCGNNAEFLSAELTKESNSSNGAPAFRIPSLVNADGTLVAVADKACTGSDWGFIELAVRTSTDNGKTWSDLKTIATPPAREINSNVDNTATAFFIDPCMTVAPNGDIVLLVTFFPESKGFHNQKILENKKAAYTEYNGAVCPLIYDRDGKFYIVSQDGTVVDSKNNDTMYTCNFSTGELKKGDEYVGNIFLNGAVGKSESDAGTTFGAPLKAPKRSYIFMLKSSDKGATWTEPKDITGSLLNLDTDGAFLAVAPGTGLTTESGRIIFPLYTKKGTVAVYSDDNGETFRRNTVIPFAAGQGEWVPVQAPTGDLYGFSRTKKYKKIHTSVSTDNGLVWVGSKSAKVKAPCCQKNALVIGDKVYVSHPNSKKRENGVISVGTFTYNKKGKFKGIKWDKKTDIKVNEGFFAYSCMAKIDEKTVGILYEDQPSSHIVFETISL